MPARTLHSLHSLVFQQTNFFELVLGTSASKFEKQFRLDFYQPVNLSTFPQCGTQHRSSWFRYMQQLWDYNCALGAERAEFIELYFYFYISIYIHQVGGNLKKIAAIMNSWSLCKCYECCLILKNDSYLHSSFCSNVAWAWSSGSRCSSWPSAACFRVWMCPEIVGQVGQAESLWRFWWDVCV